MSKREKTEHHGNGKQERQGGFGDLTEAAQALERELSRFEELAASARKMPLHTHKAIERAARATTTAAAGQELVDLALGALVRAISAARQRHEANAATLQVRGEEIRERSEAFGKLFDRYAALGEEGRIINQLVQEAAAKQREATTPEGMREVAAAIGEVEDRMAKLVEDARAYGQAAAAESIADLTEQAESLRQQMAAARNKMGLLRRSLEAQLPDPSQLN